MGGTVRVSTMDSVVLGSHHRVATCCSMRVFRQKFTVEAAIGVATPLTGWHCKFRPNTEGILSQTPSFSLTINPVTALMAHNTEGILSQTPWQLSHRIRIRIANHKLCHTALH